MRPLWYHQSPVSVRGLRLAREPGTVLFWDANHLLTWLTPAGVVYARWQAPSPLAAAACADDGSAAVALGTQGQVWCFDHDLKPRWQRASAGKGLTVALAPFGGLLAVADGAGTIHFLDDKGRDAGKASNPRSFLHLAFVPERPLLIGSAEFGSVAAFDLSGKRLWHDSPVAHCGSLATTGDGSLIALACYSDGLSCYDRRGAKRVGGPRPGPCRLVALSYDGTSLLTASLDGVVRRHDHDGKVRAEFCPEAAVTSLALDALGTTGFIGLANGTVMALGAA